jgi:hypothetical protein
VRFRTTIDPLKPVPASSSQTGGEVVRRRDVLGGLTHEYYGAAA